jgi:hypothetical protein
MNIGQVILKEELSWSDVQMKYSGNTVLLQMIMQAGQDPRNQTDGKTDWGSAIDLGSANYQKYLADQKTKQAKSDKTKEKPDKDDSISKKVGAQIGNQNAYKGGAQIPGLKDLPKLDTSTLAKSATTSFALGRALGDFAGNKVTYTPKRSTMAASKKNPGNKL